MSDFWIPVSYDDSTSDKLCAAVGACYRVHVFTLETLNDYFIDHAENYLLGNFRRELAIFLRKNKGELKAQHYTLTKAAEKTFPYFSENKKINDKGKFLPVQPIPARDYTSIQIEGRQIWRRYLALNSLITTAYGTIYLDSEEWPQIVAEQAAAKNVAFEAVPFLWHSVTVHVDADQPKLRFNLHEPDSKFNRLSRQEMKYYVRSE